MHLAPWMRLRVERSRRSWGRYRRGQDRACEAARTGDHGRGFAVVADEVRKLAEKTVKATREIDQTGGAIQSGSRDVVQAIDQGVSTVASSRKLGEQAKQPSAASKPRWVRPRIRPAISPEAQRRATPRQRCSPKPWGRWQIVRRRFTSPKAKKPRRPRASRPCFWLLMSSSTSTLAGAPTPPRLFCLLAVQRPGTERPPRVAGGAHEDDRVLLGQFALRQGLADLPFIRQVIPPCPPQMRSGSNRSGR